MQGPGIVNRPFVLGTRGSALALAQVDLVGKALLAVAPDLKIEVKKITTSGDQRSDFSDAYASGAGVKGLFTKEIEQALLDGTIDAAVHSCKDLPGHLAQGLEVRAVLERADTADVLIAKTPQAFSALPQGAHIATSSVRRRRQLLWLRPDLVIEEMRGNVPTRINKLGLSNVLDGIVLAKAGLDRLGLSQQGLHLDILPTLPAIGQGAIAIECRSNDDETASLLAKINHNPTFLRIRAERELLRLLNGDCHLPVGVGTQLEGAILSMQTIIFGAEGEPPRTASESGSADAPEELAATLFNHIQP